MQRQCNVNATTSQQPYIDELRLAFRVMKGGNISLNSALGGVVFCHPHLNLCWQKVGENPYNFRN
jgi:hypothetical protein